jgi:hypothetical protein
MRNTLEAVLVIAVLFPALSYAIMAGSRGDAAPMQALRSFAAAAIAPRPQPGTVTARRTPYACGSAAIQSCTPCHLAFGIHNHPAVELCTACHSK